MSNLMINGVPVEPRPPVPRRRTYRYYGYASFLWILDNPFSLPPGRHNVDAVDGMRQEVPRLRAACNLLEYVLTVLEDGCREFMFYPGFEEESFYQLKSEEDFRKETELEMSESWQQRIARVEPLLRDPEKVKWALQVRHDVVHGSEHAWRPVEVEWASEYILDAILDLLAYLPKKMAWTIQGLYPICLMALIFVPLGILAVVVCLLILLFEEI